MYIDYEWLKKFNVSLKNWKSNRENWSREELP
jgi:hypothetical protein